MESLMIKRMPLIQVGIIAITLISVSAIIAIKYFPSQVDHAAVEEIALDAVVNSSGPSISEKTEISSSLNIDAYMDVKSDTNNSIANKVYDREDAAGSYQVETAVKGGYAEKRRSREFRSDVQNAAPGLSSSSFAKPGENPAVKNRSIRYNAVDDSYEVNISGNEVYENNTNYQKEENTAEAGNVIISRNVVQSGVSNDEADIILSIYIDGNPPNGLIVKEFVPNGWQVFASEPQHNNYNASSGQIKWLFMGSDVNSMTIRYKVARRDMLAGGLSLHGIYIYNDPEEGNRSMNIESVNEI